LAMELMREPCQRFAPHCYDRQIFLFVIHRDESASEISARTQGNRHCSRFPNLRCRLPDDPLSMLPGAHDRTWSSE
jgi:hypothetical protein